MNYYLSRIAFTISLGFIFLPATYAQHLGLNAGDSLEVVRRKTSGLKPTQQTTGYKATSLPQNPPGNDGDYRLVIGKEAGLCQIAVFWKINSDSRYGDRTQEKFEQLENALDKKYGSGTKYKFVRAGALWDDDDEFMMSLLKDERYHSSYWDDEDGQKVPASTQIISLEALGTSSSSAMIKLSYQFKNFSECKKERETVDNSML